MNQTMSLNQQPKKPVKITTFGNNHRLPPAYDHLIHAWLLPNPYTQHKAETGLSDPVKLWFERRPPVARQIAIWLEEVKQKLKKGASHIVIGCQGGRHRSVYTAEQIAMKLRAEGYEVEVSHLELRREKN